MPDEPSEPHSAMRFNTEIDGVFTLSYPQVSYRHGSLIEILHPEWQQLFEEQISHCYFIFNKSRFCQEWHYHENTTDRYSVVNGIIEVALFDARENSNTKGKLVILKLVGVTSGDIGNNGIRIPKGVWHSIKSQGDFTLMNFKSLPFERSRPDKFRIPMPNEKCNFTWLDN